MSIPISQFIPPSLTPDVHMFVLYVSVYISALQISSSVPFFYRFHMCGLICDISFSLSLCMFLKVLLS